MNRSELRRAIFLQCRNLCSSKDTESIKQMRDDIAFDQFGVVESELDDSQRTELLRVLKNNRPAQSIATRKQCNYVRELAFEFAVLYHDYTKTKFTNKVGEVMNPDDVRIMVQEQYKSNGFLGVPTFFRRKLYEDTANPKCNELLGTRQQDYHDDSIFYYDRMSYADADKLIKRFMKLLNKAKFYKQMGKPNNYSNN